MPRQARLDAPGALHHIMVRGINRAHIFADVADKTRFLERLGQNLRQGQCAVYAWVLLDNHAHLLFRSGQASLSAVMRRQLTWYAQDYNRRHRRRGHVFENRYKSILCEEDQYLLALVRYIHLNPLRANIVKTLAELDRYPFCGHRTLLGKTHQPWMDPGYVLSRFGRTRRQAVTAYRQFMWEGVGLGRQPELTGGGLRRSLGGWSQVLAQRRAGAATAGDARILGSGAFVQAILQETEERQLRQLKLRRAGRTIQTLIDEESRKASISPMEVRNGVRRRAVSQVRAAIASRGRTELGLSSAEMARHLGVAASSISRVVERADAKR